MTKKVTKTETERSQNCDQKVTKTETERSHRDQKVTSQNKNCDQKVISQEISGAQIIKTVTKRSHCSKIKLSVSHLTDGIWFPGSLPGLIDMRFFFCDTCH